MFPVASAPRPGESGQRASTHPHPVGLHITSAVNRAAVTKSASRAQQAALTLSPRNIRQSPGWLWQEKQALRHIAQSFPASKRATARSIYLALTEVASNQRTPERAHTSCAYLGSIAGVSEGTARRYLHEFAAIGLIAAQPGVHQANTYLLLATEDYSADLAGSEAHPSPEEVQYIASNRRQRGINGDTPPAAERLISAGPTSERGCNGDTPGSQRGIISHPQDSRIESKNEEQQTDSGGDVGSLLANGASTSSIATEPKEITIEQRQATLSLVGLGIRRTMAEALASEHPAERIRAWVLYALRQTGLKSRAGFVIAQLRSGEAPPAPQSGNERRYSPTLDDQLQQTAPTPSSPDKPIPTPLTPPGAGERAIWQAAQGMLAASGTGAWLEQIRLLALSETQASLNLPPTGMAHLAERYRDEIAANLSALLGREVTVEFVAGW